MAQPGGMSMYQTVLAGGRSGNGPEGNERLENDDDIVPFNAKFEDIKELHQVGEPPIILRTENQYERTRGKRERPFGEFSLLLRRIINLDQPAKPMLQLEIQSGLLRSEFRRLAQGMTSISLSHDPIVIPEPYKELYHCGKRIQDALQKPATEEIRQELQLLVDFQKNHMVETVDSIASCKKFGTIEFDLLWGLFTPGKPVVIQNTSASATPIEWCAILKSYQEVTSRGTRYWCVTVAHTGFNGQSFGSVHTDFDFPAFSGTMNIIELPVYPLEFCRHKDQLKMDATARGAKYEQYCIASAKESPPPIGEAKIYAGPFWTKRNGDDEDSRRGCQIHDSPSHTISGRVIVDVEGFLSLHLTFRDTLMPETSGHADMDDNSSDTGSIDRYLLRRRYRQETGGSANDFAAQLPRKPLSSDQQLTCPPFIPGFCFANRSWGLFLIDELSDIKWDPSVYDKLQIDGSVKDTLRGLVKGHAKHSTEFDDFIQGKGQGLVFLLHGPPGCGKTMTAESIAESLERPLFSVSGGELGTEVGDIQAALERSFWLVARWQSILLLDEADAFLAERRGDSVERNALISVFLRLLEYQSGIIFLTTNRLVDFDEAFHSRIHISIPFPELDKDKKMLVWRNLASEKCGCNLSDAEAVALGSLPVDGRTIKNILRLASLFCKTHDDEADMCFSDIKAMLPLALGATDPEISSLVAREDFGS